MMNIRDLAVLSLLLLSACGEQAINVTSKPLEIDIAKTADPAAVRMLDVNFRVITKDNIDQFMAELTKTQGTSPVFVAMSITDYENLALDLTDLKRYILQQKAVIVYYRSVTSPSEPH